MLKINPKISYLGSMKASCALLIGYIFLVFISSCNKKETEASVAPTGSVTSSDLSNCYGQIDFQEFTSINQGTASVVKMPLEARFYDLPLLNSAKQDVDVGNVSINGITLKKNGGITTNRIYADTTNQLFSLAVFTLDATGSPVSSKINFKYDSGSPSFSDTSLIPSVIQRSSGIDITFKNILNADSLEFSLERNAYEKVLKQVSISKSNEATVKISRNEVVDLMQSYADATIRIIVFKKVLLRSGNKDYLVYSRKVFTKPVLVSLF